LNDFFSFQDINYFPDDLHPECHPATASFDHEMPSSNLAKEFQVGIGKAICFLLVPKLDGAPMYLFPSIHTMGISRGCNLGEFSTSKIFQLFHQMG
jgi:hypothetical protein